MGGWFQIHVNNTATARFGRFTPRKLNPPFARVAIVVSTSDRITRAVVLCDTPSDAEARGFQGLPSLNMNHDDGINNSESQIVPRLSPLTLISNGTSPHRAQAHVHRAAFPNTDLDGISSPSLLIGELWDPGSSLVKGLILGILEAPLPILTPT